MNPRPNSVIYLPLVPDTLTECSRQPFLCQHQHVFENKLEVSRRKVAAVQRPGDTLHCSIRQAKRSRTQIKHGVESDNQGF